LKRLTWLLAFAIAGGIRCSSSAVPLKQSTTLSAPASAEIPAAKVSVPSFSYPDGPVTRSTPNDEIVEPKTKACSELTADRKGEANRPGTREELRKACNDGDFTGCNRWGVLELEAGNRDLAKGLFQFTCENGNSTGCANLGGIYLLEGNNDQGVPLEIKACDSGKIGTACANLGVVAEQSGDRELAPELK
jgi:hypothetical protein